MHSPNTCIKACAFALQPYCFMSSHLLARICCHVPALICFDDDDVAVQGKILLSLRYVPSSEMILPTREQIRDKPYESLTRVFLLSKFLLLILACLSPGPGYDTSTQLLSQLSTSNSDNEASSPLRSIAQHISSKLVRWDAIYFVSNAKDGFGYEQQWAFSWSLSTIINRLTHCMGTTFV